MQNDILTTGETLFDMSKPIQNIIDLKGAQYLVRTAGSFLVINDTKVSDAETTVEILTTVLKNWEERTSEVTPYGKCRYFSANVPIGMKAFQGAVSIDEFVSVCHENGLRMNVEINPIEKFGGTAVHQNEIVSYFVPVQETNEVWIIIGNPKGPNEDWEWEDGVVYTWHPGKVYSVTETVVKLKE